MSLQFDQKTDGQVGGANTLTVTPTITATPNNILVAAVFCSIGDNVTGVTATKGGSNVAMVLIDKMIRGDIAGEQYVYLLTGVDTGVINVIASATGTPNLRLSAISYVGAKQTGQPDAATVGGDTQTTNPTTVSLTTVAANCWLVMLTGDDNEDACTLSSGGGISRGAIVEGKTIFDSNAALLAGSNSLIIEHGFAGQALRSLVLSIAPDVPVAGGTLMGQVWL